MTNPTPNQSSARLSSIISESKLFAGKFLTIIKVTKTVNTNPSQVRGSRGIIRDQKCGNGTGLEIIKHIVSDLKENNQLILLSSKLRLN